MEVCAKRTQCRRPRLPSLFVILWRAVIHPLESPRPGPSSSLHLHFHCHSFIGIAMPEEQPAKDADVEAALSTLQISSNPVAEDPEKQNPWQDPSPILEVVGSTSSNPVILNDDGAKDDELQKNPFASGTTSPTTKEEAEERRRDVLQEFDPLANQEEKAARDAWETAESHPSLPAKADPSTPASAIPPSSSAPELASPRPASPVSGFPALAALARTFAIPLVAGRQRPRSLDAAASVPSPATISSFATQQQAPPIPPPKPESEQVSPASTGRSTPITPARTRSMDSNGDPPQFDFQKFLDQMKLKSAEPVAKYLRSYVSV